MFIRICGTHNTANEVFHCVHFECPCRPDILKAYLNEQSSTQTSDDYVSGSITFDEYSKSFESLLDSTNPNSSSTSDTGSLVQTHTILPFQIKSNSSAIYSIEDKNTA